MRVRTAGRRQAIIEAALQVFREVGYERASMGAISGRVGGSKSTLYGYFKSKEELFAVAMISVMEDQVHEAVDLLDASATDVSRVLMDFSAAYLALVTSNNALSIRRTAIAEGSNSDLGARLYEMGVERAWHEIANYVLQLQERNRFRQSDPHVAAAHLKGLLEAGIVEPLLFGAAQWFAPDDAVRDSVRVFMTAYGAEHD